MIGSITTQSFHASFFASSSSRVERDDPQTREAFEQFFGQTFYGQMIGALRQGAAKPEYFYGGRAEEVFRGQLDQAIADELTKRTASDLAGPMYEIFMLGRS